MKKFRKIMAVLVAAMIVMSSFTLTAFATPTSANTITIDNAIAGETYSAYKIFDVTYSGTNSEYQSATPATDVPGDPDAGHAFLRYAYTISTTSQWWNLLSTADADNNPITTTDGKKTLTKFGLILEPTTDATIYNVRTVDATNGPTADQMQKLAAFLGANTAAKVATNSATANATTTNHNGDYSTGSLVINVGPDSELSPAQNIQRTGPGYYFVDTTTGSFCSLDTTEPNATVREKNSIPSADKKVSDAANGSYADEATVKIGDTVYFSVTVKNSKGPDKDVKVHDKMSTELTLDIASFAVKVGGADVAADKYTINLSNAVTNKKGANSAVNLVAPNTFVGADGTTVDDCTFEIVLDDAYVASLPKDTEIVISYSAELNKTAKTSAPFQTNTMHLTYSNQTTATKTTTVKTYEADVIKTDKTNKLLEGATFKLYDAATGGTEYNLVLVEAGKYRIKESTDAAGDVVTKMATSNGQLTIVGLENATYYLEEVDHPAGFYPLATRQAFTINAANLTAVLTDANSDGVSVAGIDSWTSGGVQVINESGVELPSTGGMGTTVLYIVGGMLVILAGAYLFFSRKKTA